MSLQAKDTISAKEAECYVTVEGKRYNFAHAKNVEAKVDKDKSDVALLGKIMKGHKTTGASGSGSLSMYYVTSIFRKLLKHYKDTGEDFYFDMQITNDDKTSSVGRQTTILKDCNLDSLVIAKFDAEGDVIDEDVDFTFEDFEMPEEFTAYQGLE